MTTQPLTEQFITEQSITEQPTTVLEDPTPRYAPQPALAPVPAGAHGNAFAVTSFVLGIASIVAGWTFVAPIIGLILGIISLRRRTEERTLALWGVWLNVAMLVISAFIVVLVLGVFGFSLLAGLSSGAFI